MSASQSNSLTRCSWCGKDELYVKYHDQEWGKPVYDDRVLFEYLVLEGAQAGLSWITILRKREGYRKAFAGFDAVKVAAFTPEQAEALMLNDGIIKNRLKIKATISNAQHFLQIQKDFGSFANYIWGFMPNKKPLINHFDGNAPARTDISDAIAKDMKKRGFKFFGSTICYAFMQAVGMVNDHIPSCSFR